MNFFKSSLFSDFKLQDVLAFNQEDPSSSSGDSETLISSEPEDITSTDAEILPDSQSEALISSDAERHAVSDARSFVDGRSETLTSSDAGTVSQEESTEGIWGLGGLMKSITLKSGGILQAYRKDLEEFSSGLKKETQLIAEVAAHAVKDLPTSLESGAFLAQESIESVGQVVEDFSSSVWRGTADLIAQGKEAVLSIDEDESITPAGAASSSSSISRYENAPVPISGGKYSRFEAQVRAMQHDSSTYCDEPADLADYTAFKSVFSLSDKKHDIDTLVAENTFLQELLLRFVPDIVTEETFWTRYFYRFHKLQQAEEARADLVKRASAVEEEDLGWDTEEELEEGGTAHDEQAMARNADDGQEVLHRGLQVEGEQPDNTEIKAGKDSGTEGSPQTHANDHLGPSKELAEEEEDLGWEVAEDVEESSSNDGKRSSNSEASWEVPDVPKDDIRKRFTAQEDDEEDLSWDVDDAVDDAK
eukprot:c25009_g3_i1 orf=202-1629(+)